MKRLLKKHSRLRRKIMAAWQQIDITSPDIVQIVTDAMAINTWIQIEYLGSGWRIIQPYGWNSSHDGNVLLMCYKDTGEIRSYRLDRIQEIFVDDTLLATLPEETIHDNGIFQVQDYNEVERANPEDFEIPPLPNMDEIMKITEQEAGQELPFEDALDILIQEPMDNGMDTIEPMEEYTEEPSDKPSNVITEQDSKLKQSIEENNEINESEEEKKDEL